MTNKANNILAEGVTEEALNQWADRLDAQSNLDEFRAQALLTIFHIERGSVRALLSASRARFPGDSGARLAHFLGRLGDSE
jgi:hypothetical protein